MNAKLQSVVGEHKGRQNNELSEMKQTLYSLRLTFSWILKIKIKIKLKKYKKISTWKGLILLKISVSIRGLVR